MNSVKFTKQTTTINGRENILYNVEKVYYTWATSFIVQSNAFCTSNFDDNVLRSLVEQTPRKTAEISKQVGYISSVHLSFTETRQGR